MEPVIAPSTFYWLDVVSTLSAISTVLFGISIALLVIILIFLMIFLMEDELKGYFGKVYKRLCVIVAVITIVSGLNFIFIPSKETLIAMTVAKYVTPDNMTSVGGTIEESVSYITNEIIQVIEAASDKEDTKSD